jgi:hypothetical protein
MKTLLKKVKKRNFEINSVNKLGLSSVKKLLKENTVV